ncbi:TetR/AcrR family transcriptional regulator [Sinomonas halotolerans]|uniref:TetR/AcrR family transcriptional regulator n=1 Tax=Sinomonas halotolerans TaxID=1644133 RepID=A0ABU9X433_9MICC
MDHRSLPRRRGEALNRAIFEAVLALVEEDGYAGLTMERVAARARTGKASLYRRWDGVPALAMDAVRDAMPGPGAIPDRGSLREDALAVLGLAAEQLRGPVGAALRGVLGEALRDPDPDRIAALSRGSALAMMRTVAERAAARGECPASCLTETRLEAGPAVMRQRFLLGAGGLDAAFLEAIVDEVVVPLLTRP